ncbi:phosphotriesterase family protein [Streptomyces specialis]|uniref:phosphotriesterase family protein n=1 Tax=Streptomyces specialis TaxID=498367 RepID=UPI00073EC6A7|nr:phosphotriesterase [Streptomyces specialis]
MTAVPGAAVRTVLGDISPGDLGVCDAHDHLFLRTPRLPGQELTDAAAAGAELRAFAALGGASVAQWTPIGMGRGARALPGLSRSTGVHIIAATGLHQAVHYDPHALRRLLDGLAERFVTELTRGIPLGGAPGADGVPAVRAVRAGLIKVAGGLHGPDAHTRHVFAAAATAHHATGAPIGVHLEGGAGAPEVLDLLCARHGVPPHRVILGHLGRLPVDPRIHRQAAGAGAYLAFDGPSPAHRATDGRLLPCLAALVEAGHAGRVLLGADTTTAAARGCLPGLLTGTAARVRRELGPEVAALFLGANPARAFATVWATGGDGGSGGG